MSEFKEINKMGSHVDKIKKEHWISVCFIDYLDLDRKPPPQHILTIDTMLDKIGYFHHLKVGNLVSEGGKISTLTWLMKKDLIQVRTLEEYITYINELVQYKPENYDRMDRITAKRYIEELGGKAEFPIPVRKAICGRYGRDQIGTYKYEEQNDEG